MAISSVELIPNDFTDLMVANCARVSFSKWNSELDVEKDTKLINYLVKHGHWFPLAHPHMHIHIPMMDLEIETLVVHKELMAGLTVKPVDHNYYEVVGSLWAFLNYAVLVEHSGILAMCHEECPISTQAFLCSIGYEGRKWESDKSATRIYEPQVPDNRIFTFRIKAPVAVARQLGKHQVSMVWNEESRRYVDYTPETLDISEWRGRPKNAKQGSSDAVIYLGDDVYEWCMIDCQRTYRQLLEQEVAPEQARMVLPQSTMVNWVWTGTKGAFDRVIGLRCQPDAQKETREVVEQMQALMYGVPNG